MEQNILYKLGSYNEWTKNNNNTKGGKTLSQLDGP